MGETNSYGYWFDAVVSYFENEMQNTLVTWNYLKVFPMLINLIYSCIVHFLANKQYNTL